MIIKQNLFFISFKHKRDPTENLIQDSKACYSSGTEKWEKRTLKI